MITWEAALTTRNATLAKIKTISHTSEDVVVSGLTAPVAESDGDGDGELVSFLDRTMLLLKVAVKNASDDHFKAKRSCKERIAKLQEEKCRISIVLGMRLGILVRRNCAPNDCASSAGTIH